MRLLLFIGFNVESDSVNCPIETSVNNLCINLLQRRVQEPVSLEQITIKNRKSFN